MTSKTLPHPTAEQIETFAKEFAKSVGEPCVTEAIAAVNYALNPESFQKDSINHVIDPPPQNSFGVMLLSERRGKCTIHASCHWRENAGMRDFNGNSFCNPHTVALMALELRQTHRTSIIVE